MQRKEATVFWLFSAQLSYATLLSALWWRFEGTEAEFSFHCLVRGLSDDLAPWTGRFSSSVNVANTQNMCLHTSKEHSDITSQWQLPTLHEYFSPSETCGTCGNWYWSRLCNRNTTRSFVFSLKNNARQYCLLPLAVFTHLYNVIPSGAPWRRQKRYT